MSSPIAVSSNLPPVLSGPLLRRLEASRLVLWLVGSRQLRATLQLIYEDSESGSTELNLPLDASCCRYIPIGQHAWVHLIEISLESKLPTNVYIHYDLLIEGAGSIADWAPHLLYPGQSKPSFVRRDRHDHLLHGSCRKPHCPSKDGLGQVDALLGSTLDRPQDRPALLILSGDQIYADDVAGPLLVAIHRLIECLGLYGETLEGAEVDSSDALYVHPKTYYRREELLPDYTANEELRERFFGGVRKPIFTTASAANHLITLAEIMAMYLLVWSPTPWRLIEPIIPANLPQEKLEHYRSQETIIRSFAHDLPQAARAMAQIPCLMIFDDHDVTDDWNLSARWEDNVYNHPFSRRIVGNALLAYLLCQGWGNAPEYFGELLEHTQALLAHRDARQYLPLASHDRIIDRLLAFKHWHYRIAGQPSLIVLDTRTRRWHHERQRIQPSGLLDWEALCELQTELIDEKSVVIVSPAPMFGVKLIEAVQRIFTWAGHPLMVDAENWMAHRGAAQVMLNIFRHSRTPANYVILSGDVHYSFTYEILIRHRDAGPRIWQITSSGIKNQFPENLLNWFDRLNRWLYSPRSPLNIFTKRRRMQVTPRIPSRSKHGERLWNSAGIGQVYLDEQGRPTQIRQLNADGSEPTSFEHLQRVSNQRDEQLQENLPLSQPRARKCK
ncbi:alkaline phosphatase D family protein [Azomonas macrocytogenes]|uniref:PhoD-like phosphatase metallophosphatase domain-containing protein n=1 Tax=Azomonas macrocytogenes TaxID=69962 RepID=A0A839T8Y7_AZOMA|nr:hypothetical protein [Azomonas macrocytogenes]